MIDFHHMTPHEGKRQSTYCFHVYLFKNNKLNLALIGPFKDKSKFSKILKF